MHRRWTLLLVLTIVTISLPIPAAVAQYVDVGEEPGELDLSRAARLGAENPLVTIAVFDDFQCPVCRKLAPELKKLVQAFPDTVGFYFLHFPVPKAHPFAEMMAIMAEAARTPGDDSVFWTLHDLFYSKRWIDEDDVEREAAAVVQQAGLDVAQWTARRADPAIKAHIQADKKLGHRVFLRGTPTLFIDGIKYEGYRPFEELRKTVEQRILLNKANQQ